MFQDFHDVKGKAGIMQRANAAPGFLSPTVYDYAGGGSVLACRETVGESLERQRRELPRAAMAPVPPQQRGETKGRLLVIDDGLDTGATAASAI